MIKIFLKKIIIKNIYLDHLYQILSSFFFYRKIKNYPFGKKVIQEKENYLRLFQEAKKKQYPQVILLEKKKNFTIDKEWLDDLAMITQVTIKNSNICYAHGRVLYSSLSHYIEKLNEPINIIETGTSKGFSSLCMAKALYDLKKNGLIHTIDLLPIDKKIYWNSISDFEGMKTRSQLLNKWNELNNKYIKFYEGFSKKILKKINLNRVHFAFIDGSHTYLDVLYELNYVASRQLENDIIVIDDYNLQYPGLIKATSKVIKSFNYSLELINSSKNRTYAICIKNSL
tara:strand:+ start:3259 stop:4113 length:855 start_codon:yes stop_codon:yes gene_type:complete